MTPHTCHAIGCTAVVPPTLFSCWQHWRVLPRDLRNAIYASYRPGQEQDKQPSDAYLTAANAARHWWHQAERIPTSDRCIVCIEERKAAP